MFRHLFCAERVIPDILVKIFYVFVGKFDFFFVRFTAMNSAMWLPKSMVFGEVSPVQFSELMSQASPSDMQSVFHSGIEEGYSYGPAVCPRCGGQMGEKAYWDFC